MTAGLLIGVLSLMDGAYLAVIWPDWEALGKGAVPKSAFIERYEASSGHRAVWRQTSYKALPEHLRRAVILAEDSRFLTHGGIDFAAVRDAMRENFDRGEVVFGASTISQQTVKNMFLSPSRTPWRKWHELLLTWAMERNLPKWRILHIYLNVVELGAGLFGVEAAAHHYWGISASRLSARQAAELAASLPSPRRDNPETRTKRFERRLERVLGHMGRFGSE